MNLIDLESDVGFVQAAGKKKKKQTTTFNWLDDEGDKKKDGDGADDGGDGNKDQNGGDSGSTGGNGGDDGDKKDNGKNGGEANDDDIWDLAPVGGKKKNKSKAADANATDGFGLPEIPSTDFHEIRLDDAGGGGEEEDSLDLGLGTKAEKITTGITAWTSSWATGSWGWGGLKSPSAQSPKPVEDEQPKPPASGDNNPWGVQSGKSKQTTSAFAFGSFDQADETKDEPLDFLGSSKLTDKKEVGAFSWGAPTPKTADNAFWGKSNSPDVHSTEGAKLAATQEASDDIWGFSSIKKDVSLQDCSAARVVAVWDGRADQDPCRKRRTKLLSSMRHQPPKTLRRIRFSRFKPKRAPRMSPCERLKPL